jgi:hypothetical protein
MTLVPTVAHHGILSQVILAGTGLPFPSREPLRRIIISGLPAKASTRLREASHTCPQHVRCVYTGTFPRGRHIEAWKVGRNIYKTSNFDTAELLSPGR